MDKFQEMISYSQKIFNEQYGFKNKKLIAEKKNAQTTRPKSFDKKTKCLENSPILNPIKKKIDLHQDRSKNTHKTMGTRSEIEKSLKLKNSSERFPSINISKNAEERSRNFSGYISSSAKKEGVSQNSKILMDISSPSPTRKTYQGQRNVIQGLEVLEQKILNRGNFVAPKTLEMGFLFDEQSLNSEKTFLNSHNNNLNSFSPTFVHKSATKNKTIEQIVNESGLSNKKETASPTKKMTYEFLIDSLSEVRINPVLSNKTSEDFKLKLRRINSK